MVEIDEIMDGLLKQWVTFFCKHKVVRDANRNGFWKDDGVYEERVYWAKASNIQIDINTSIMVENKVTDSVGTLYGICVVVKGIEKP